MFQLRCVRVDSAAQSLSEQKWAEMDCSWPEAIYIHVNGVEHYIRRKVHHGKDLPVNISPSLKESDNKVTVTYLPRPHSLPGPKEPLYAVALEKVETAEVSRLVSMIRELSGAICLRRITDKLAKAPANDDELCIVDEHVTINLVDPFTSRIFDCPVRAIECRHWECFDRDTYLLTRLTKVVDGTGMAETWRCPICRADARPQVLYVDGFMTAVRSKLVEMNRLETAKAILVKGDGSWAVREEKNQGRDRASNTPMVSKNEGEDIRLLPGLQAAAKGTLKSPTPRMEPEVIEID
jgi:hypothetical protein